MAKICRVCKQIKEPTEFTKNNQRKSGIDTKCKKCHAHYNKKYVVARRKENQKTKEKIILDKKTCNCCFIEKEINEFVKCFSYKDGHRNKCISCYKKSQNERHKLRINKYSTFNEITCSSCNSHKSYTEYNNSGLRRVNPLCKECFNQRANSQKSSVSSECKISKEEYNILLKKQNYVCAICKKPETRLLKGKETGLSVDHCHDSQKLGINKIRGLLCARCNSGIGWFQDSVDHLKSAIIYLELSN